MIRLKCVFINRSKNYSLKKDPQKLLGLELNGGLVGKQQTKIFLRLASNIRDILMILISVIKLK